MYPNNILSGSGHRDSISHLKNIIDFIYQLPNDDWKAFSNIWLPFSAGKKTVLTSPGEKEGYLYFITEGIQRGYYQDDDDREATLFFSYPGALGGIIESLFLQKPSRFFYETLTPSTFLRAPAHLLLNLMDERPEIDKLVRFGITNTLSGVLERVAVLQAYTSEDKFKRLLQLHPHLLNLVPHKYLANYMGINPTNFSKMVNKIKI